MALIHLCRFHRTFIAKEVSVFNTFLHRKAFSFLENRQVHILCVVSNATKKTNARCFWNKKESREDALEEKNIMKKQQEFSHHEKRDRKTFLAIVDEFKIRDRQRRGHVEFVTAGIRSMKDYGVDRDLECYKKLLDIFPKKKMVPENYLQADMMHYPRQQHCVMELLEHMEQNAVCPDLEMQKLMHSIFGPYTHVSRKFGRMLYWIPKFKNLSPFPLPQILPNDIQELALLAIKRISAVDLQTVIQIFNAEDLEDSLDKTWIVGGQSPKQKELLTEHDKEKPLYVEGPFIVWLRRVSISYFILRADAKVFPELERDIDDVSELIADVLNPLKAQAVIKKPSIHEQEDGTIMAVCSTGTSSRDSALSWIRFLQKENEVLNELSILFTLKAPSKDLVTVNDKRNVDESMIEAGNEPPS